MASHTHGQDATSPAEDEEAAQSVQDVQSHYLRCPSPSFSMMSESRFSAISGSDAASIFMEPIHLSSAVAAKKIINEELPPRSPRAESVPESMLESAEQLMVEDLYNRVRDMMDDRSPYNTPCVLDLQRALVQDRLEAPVNPVDEVWPNIFIAEKSVAVNKARLKRMGITHILNAAHGTGVYTGESFYAGMRITYLGIEVDDFPDVDISGHFRSTAEFLDEALLTHKGKVLVVSMMGSSRSAILVASYLMIFQHMSILEALTAIRKKRAISPNEGFLKQLRELNETLMEERDDDDDTLSQCSVIDARTRARIFGDGIDDGDDAERDDDQSMFSVKAQSIMLEEEEDGESVMSSVASSAAALLKQVTATQNGVSATQASQDLPLPEAMDDEEDEGLDRMIRDWQRRNEVFQNEEWWEAQLNSDGEEESGDGGWMKKNGTDTESVTSEEVRAVKNRLKQRCKRPPSDAMSTSSCMSYSDLWKQRLQEIEEEAARRYHGRDEENSGTEEAKSTIDDEMASIMSDTTSMFNFCQKNREKMTPLERWRVKRIDFGWSKKDREDGEKSSVADGDKAESEARVPNLEDVNLTAYQAWKRRQQRRYGEENPEEILEMSRGEDSAAAKRRQRREELLERSKKTLEESQSLCGWEADSCVSGATIPLSAFWAGAGVTGAASAANDDNMSMLSGRSSVISSVSQPRGSRSMPSVAPTNKPLPPILPVPTVQGPGGEPMVNLSSIQNWIANVVTETIKQKQSEMSLPPPSRVPSEVSYAPATPGRPTDDDRTSMLSGSAYSSALGRGKAASVLSESRASSALTGRGSVLTSGKSKITTTSVPLFSLFQDQVDLNKLDAIDKEIKSEMRDKMATYERKKILADNKRSTMYKKKKPKEDDEEDEEAEKRREEEFLKEVKKKPARSHGLSGCLNLNPALERDTNMNIDDWLMSVRPPGKPGADQSEDLYDDLDASASMLDFSPHQDSDDEEYPTPTLRSRLRMDDDEEYSSFIPGREQRYQDYSSRRKGTCPSPAANRHRENEEDEEDDVAAFIAQTRQRVRARAAAEADDDEVLTAWRAQLESKSRGRESQDK